MLTLIDSYRQNVNFLSSADHLLPAMSLFSLSVSFFLLYRHIKAPTQQDCLADVLILPCCHRAGITRHERARERKNKERDTHASADGDDDRPLLACQRRGWEGGKAWEETRKGGEVKRMASREGENVWEERAKGIREEQGKKNKDIGREEKG